MHARPLAGQRGKRHPGIFDGVISDLEQQSVLRIRELGLARADAEELRIEAVDLIQKPAPARVHSSRPGRIRVVHRCRMPTVFGHFRDGIDAADQQPPQVFGASHPPGESTTNTDNGDRFDRTHACSRFSNSLECKAAVAASTTSPDSQWDLISENYRSNYAQLRLRIAIALRRAHHAVAAGTPP